MLALHAAASADLRHEHSLGKILLFHEQEQVKGEPGQRKQVRVIPSCFKVIGVLQMGGLLAVSAFGQSLVEAGRIPSLRQLFESAEHAQQLRCDIRPVRPQLNFTFRFEAGYVVELPLAQFHGAEHNLVIHARVTTEGHEPVYLIGNTGIQPTVSVTKLVAKTAGRFIVGEGVYGVEVLVGDNSHRFCRGAWQIEARRTGSERTLKAMTPTGVVEEFPVHGSEIADVISGPKIGRLTILLHAAPLSPNVSRLQPDDIQTLTDSLSSLLRELPAQSVKLIAFNLDQQHIIFRTDRFEATQTDDLTLALNRLVLGRVDYQILKEARSPIDFLLGIMQAELHNPAKADALIVLGPRTRLQHSIPADALREHPVPTVFMLQYQSPRALLNHLAIHDAHVASDDDPGGDLPKIEFSAAEDGRSHETFELPDFPDSIDHLMRRLKGETICVRSPHDLADAIRRMNRRIAKITVPTEVRAKVESPAQMF
jgi:hypothetical protein